MSLGDRQDNLLKIIIEEYIESANPVGSGFIAGKHFPDLSSATIRNDMAELEKQGLIYQPHTSAGRIPTIDGYKKYLDGLVTGEITTREKRCLDDAPDDDFRQTIKKIAKSLAQLSNNAAFVSFSDDDYYYTGISNLFRQPEFVERASLYDMSDVIDHMEDVIFEAMKELESGQTQVLLGSNNPFGKSSTAIIARYKSGSTVTIIGILGPNRLNYKQGLGLVEYARKLLSNN